MSKLVSGIVSSLKPQYFRPAFFRNSACAPFLSASSLRGLQLNRFSTAPQCRQQNRAAPFSASIVQGPENAALTKPANQTIENINLLSFFVASKIDIDKVWENEFSDHRHHFQKHSVIVFIDDHRDISEDDGPFMVIFEYGAVVFGNCDKRLTDYYINKIRKYATELIEMDQTPQEDFLVQVDTNMPKLSELRQGSLTALAVQKWDLYHISVVSQILAQSVALSHYERVVLQRIRMFSALNTEIAHRHLEGRRAKESLNRAYSENNGLLTEIIAKIRLLDRFETTWKYSEYSSSYDLMRSEFELSSRFNTLRNKLEHVLSCTQDSWEFFSQLGSEMASKIIIALIFCELLLGSYKVHKHSKKRQEELAAAHASGH